LSALRLPISFVLALATVIALFWTMGLATSARQTPESVLAVARIDFSRLVRDSDTQEIARVKPEIKKIEPPPSPQNVSTNTKASVAAGLDQSSLAPAGVDFGGSGEGGLRQGGAQSLAMASGNDRGPVPQVRIEPEYPSQAKDRGVEGWVLFQFTVTREGRVKDIVILDAQPKGTWDRSTIRAASNWRYQPALKDGKPVETTGVKVKHIFELER
jgi:periplasmic protein TonB